jgi:hypothetical protein
VTGRRLSTQLLVAGLVLVAALAWAGPAMAQDPTSGDGAPKQAAIAFDLGRYSTELHDWTIEAVLVSGDLEDDREVTIEIRGAGDRVLWTASAPFHAPQTRIEVDAKLGVADVSSAGVSQAGTVVDATAGVDPRLVPSEVVDPVQGGGGSSGQVATSMVLVIIVAVILFRTPLPAASTQRWTK